MVDSDFEERREIAIAIQRAAWDHAVTLRISELEDDREVGWNTATGVLMQLAGQWVVATAWHVIARYVELRASGRTAVVLVGNFPMLWPRSVYRDELNDLVLLEVPIEARADLGALPYVADGRWPPRQVVVGDDVLVCGFPAIFRTDSREIEHGDLTFVGEVESVSNSQFVLLPFERETIDLGRVPFPSSDRDLGGISGAPAFGLYQDGMQLVGIFSQGGNLVPAWIVRSLNGLPPELASPSVPL